MGNIQFDSIDDLSANFKSRHIYELKLNKFQPSVTVEFGRLGVRLYVFDDTKDAGIFYNIDRIVMRARLKPAFMYSYYTVWGANAAFPILGLFLPSWIVLSGNSLWLLWLTHVLYIRFRKSSDIRIHENHDKPGFFTRTKDQLILAAISSISSLLIGCWHAGWRLPA
jgi:hypothetical protein